jgi:5-methylcytosine-specific restriction endonuclease McrA
MANLPYRMQLPILPILLLDKMDKEIARKYDQLLNRSFDRDLSMFLFKCFIEGITSTSYIYEEYVSFIPDTAIVGAYIAVHQLSKQTDIIEGTRISVGEFDKYIKDWFIKNSNSAKQLKAIYSNRFISPAKFLEFYNTQERKCAYCDITENEIRKLISKKRIYTKSLFNRGRSLEIDRKDSLKSYQEGNIVFCCYWCNNAKTDEFSESEFKNIGKQIKVVWQERLEKAS